MVNLFSSLTRDSVRQGIARATGLIEGVRGGWVSQREFSRLTGIPRSTLQDFLRDPSRARDATFQRIAQAATSTRVTNVQEGMTTLRIDAPVFTRDLIGNIVIPEGSTAVRFVVPEDTYPGGWRSTEWLDVEEGDLPTLLDDLGIDPTDIARVVVDRGL